MAISELGNHASSNWGTAMSDTHGLVIAANDVVVIDMVSAWTDPFVTLTDNNGAYTFTKAGNFPFDNGSVQMHCWYRVAGASEPAAYAFTGDESASWGMIVRVYRGVDTANVWDVEPHSTRDDDGTGTTATAPTITTNYDGSLAVCRVWTNSTSVTFSDPTNGFAGAKANPTGQSNGVSYTKLLGGAGAVGATACTISGSAGWAALLYALRAAPTGEAPTVTTTAISDITATTATGGGTITDDGGAEVTAYGVCWNTTGTPTTADSHTHDEP